MTTVGVFDRRHNIFIPASAKAQVGGCASCGDSSVVWMCAACHRGLCNECLRTPCRGS